MRIRIAAIIAIFMVLCWVYGVLLLGSYQGYYCEEKYVVNADIPISISVIRPKEIRSDIPILLVHGYSGNRKTMKPLAITLASIGFVCVTIDLRGHGSSGGSMIVTDPLRVGFFEADILSTLRYLGSMGLNNESVIMVGHSMGGSIVSYLGIKYDFVLGVVSIAASIGRFADIAPRNFNVDNPRNVLFVLAGHDNFVNRSSVYEAFYRSLGFVGSENRYYHVDGGLKALFVDYGANHINVIYSEKTHRYVSEFISKLVYGDAVRPEVCGSALKDIAKISGLMGFLGVLLIIGTIHVGRIDVVLMSMSKGPRRNMLIYIVFGFVIYILSASLLLITTHLGIASLTTGSMVGFAFSVFLAFKPKITFSSVQRRAHILMDFAFGVLLWLGMVFVLEVTIGTYVMEILEIILARIIFLPIYLVCCAMYFLAFKMLRNRYSSAKSIVITLLIFVSYIALLSFTLSILGALILTIILVNLSIQIPALIILNRKQSIAVTTALSLLYASMQIIFTPIISFA